MVSAHTQSVWGRCRQNCRASQVRASGNTCTVTQHRLRTHGPPKWVTMDARAMVVHSTGVMRGAREPPSCRPHSGWMHCHHTRGPRGVGANKKLWRFVSMSRSMRAHETDPLSRAHGPPQRVAWTPVRNSRTAQGGACRGRRCPLVKASPRRG